MHPLVQRGPAQKAFTLLEVMLAVTILGLVMTAVYATWSAGLNGWKRSSTVTAALQRERIVMDTLTELASSIVYFKSTKGLYDILGEHDEFTGDSVSFVTSSDALLPQTESLVGGMRRVTIALQRDEQGNPFLSIVNSPALEPPDTSAEHQTHVLSADVRGFQVRYRNPQDESWEDKWEERRMIPLAIEFTVAFGGTGGQTPPAIVTRAVDIPVARFGLLAQGLQANQQSTTNQIGRRDINLLPSQSTETGFAQE